MSDESFFNTYGVEHVGQLFKDTINILIVNEVLFVVSDV